MFSLAGTLGSLRRSNDRAHAHLPKCRRVSVCAKNRNTDEYDPTIGKISRLAAEFSRSRYFLNERTGYLYRRVSLSRRCDSKHTRPIESDGRQLWEFVQDAFAGIPITNHDLRERPQARFGEPTLVRPRLGQGAFRIVVTDNYQRRCAISGERTLPALDAAHIRPYAEGGLHEPSNGVLLRRDIHKLPRPRLRDYIARDEI